ncbi:hypothetical protein [Tsuneonella amylolytica]|uniref:hypothetical protein n=1 Tax=Tsuneonella amylolytica TaxID=2338327 RepID=UPI0013C478BD|nr:hypothetical protein [Tsuneonella amylolytica]
MADAYGVNGIEGPVRTWQFGPRSRSIFWLSFAAIGAVAIGAFLQGAWLVQGQESPFVYEAGSLIAAGELESVLYDPSLLGYEGAPQVSDEFRNAQGQVCRRFTDDQVSGVACRVGGDWRVEEMRQD